MRRHPVDGWGQRRLAPFVWLIWAFAAGAVLAGSALTLTTRTLVPDTRRFPGILRPSVDPISIVLPAGIPLQAVLVSEGAEVRAGQTLATLDAGALTQRLDEIRTQIQENEVLHRCLIDGTGLDAMGQPTPETLDGIDPEADDLLPLRTVLADCALDRRILREERAGLDEARRLLVSRRNLLSQRIALALAPDDQTGAAPPVIEIPPSLLLQVTPDLPTDDDATPTDHAQTVVALALARSVLEEQLLELRRAAEIQAQTAERALLTRTGDLAQAIQDLSAEQNRLSRYVLAPRLTAPQMGFVSTLRNIKPGVTFSDSTEIIALTSAPGRNLEAIVALPTALSAQLQTGDQAWVHLIAQTTSGPLLSARLGPATPLPPTLDNVGHVGRSVVLDGTATLSLEDSTLAFRGRSTAAAIELRLDRITLTEALSRGARRLAQTTAAMRWSARIEALRTPDAPGLLRAARPPTAEWPAAPL